jgi:hypothetical protein
MTDVVAEPDALTLLREVRPLLSASEVGVALAAEGSTFTLT